MFPLTLSVDSGHNGRMTQTPDTTPAPTVARSIGRNLDGIAAMLRDIEPDEMSRPELLDLLGVLAASAQLSAALLDQLADRLNLDALARCDRMLAAIEAVNPQAAADVVAEVAGIMDVIR